MEPNNTLAVLPNRFNIPVNVGTVGGDLPTRYFAAALILFLTIAVAPPLHVTYGTLKIFSLLASMSGTILLMAGLVFSQKTHFAGVMLIITAFSMMLLASSVSGWVAILIGLIVLGSITQNLLTKRCGINRLFGIQSCER